MRLSNARPLRGRRFHLRCRRHKWRRYSKPWRLRKQRATAEEQRDELKREVERLEQVRLALAVTAAAEDALRVEDLAETGHGEPGPAEVGDDHEGRKREPEVGASRERLSAMRTDEPAFQARQSALCRGESPAGESDSPGGRAPLSD